MSGRGPLVIGVDVSTTAAKAVAFDKSGLAIAEGRATFALSNPSPDAWEQRANDWLSATQTAIGQLVGKLTSTDRAAIGAVAIAHQRETFVVTDPSGKPLAPAIVWMDARSRSEVEAVVRASGDGGQSIHDRTGKPACVTPSLYKIKAFFERLHPELAGTDVRVLDVHGFLALHLTGELATSMASADPLGLVDLRRGAWDEELAKLAHVAPSALARLVPPGATIGPIKPDTCRQLGLPVGTPLVAGAGDGQAAGLGCGVLREGEAYLNIGTAIVCGVPSSTYRVDRAFRTLSAATPGGFLLETDLKGGTFTLDWLADRLLGSGEMTGGLDRMVKLADLEARAAKLPPMSDGLVALPYWAGVMSPYWDDDATGALIGLRGDHGPEHVFRALSEAMAFEQRLALEGVEKASVPVTKIVTVGGGARRPFFAKLCATILGRDLTMSRIHETTALGAAIIAAPVAGLAPDIESASRAMSGDGEVFEPGPDKELYDRAYREIYVDLYPTLRRATTALAKWRTAATPPR